jgi:hypothetical protein
VIGCAKISSSTCTIGVATFLAHAQAGRGYSEFNHPPKINLKAWSKTGEPLCTSFAGKDIHFPQNEASTFDKLTAALAGKMVRETRFIINYLQIRTLMAILFFTLLTIKIYRTWKQ